MICMWIGSSHATAKIEVLIFILISSKYPKRFHLNLDIIYFACQGNISCFKENKTVIKKIIFLHCGQSLRGEISQLSLY